jgi:hypothetical protein
VTFEGPGQPEQSGERKSQPDLLGFLSEFRAASSPVSEKLSYGTPEAEADHPVADPSGTDDHPSAFLTPSRFVPVPKIEPAPSVPATGPVGFPPAGFPLAGAPLAGPPPAGSPPAGAPRGLESHWPPPSPPGPTPPNGAPLPYGGPAPYGNTLPYSFAPPESRPGRGKVIGIVAASVVGLILVLAAIPTVLGSRSGLHPVFTPAGYKAFTEKTDRFSLAVPDSWESVDPSSPGAAEAFQQLEANNPAFQSVVGGDVTNLASRGMKFLAVGDQSSVNVVVKPLFGASGSSLTQLQSQLPSLYQSLGATLVSNEILQLNGREALEATVEQPFNEPNGSNVVVDETQEFFAGNDLLYSVTLAGSSSDLAAIGSTFNIGS